jgi:formate C-acetyltransferase
LNRGRDKFSGEQIGYPTPDPIIFTSIEEIMQACLKQYTFFVAKLVSISQIADALYEEYTPRPFLSALLDGCIENGEDCSKWNHHRWTLIVGGGINVADSLAAIKKLVFEEKRVSMPDLLDTLRNDWEGKEDLRQIFLNEAPKFGNDDDYVDLIAKELYYKMERETKKFAYRGVPLTIDGSILVTGYSFGIDTGATPDGRKDREAFHDGTISPAQGRDKKGPTAVLKSVSKIDPLLSFNHLLNQRFAPVFLEGKNREVFANYLKTWADLGIHHIQFNVVNKELMLDAQQHPERHTDLIVRVAGYAAYFVDLSRGLQDDIIRRTEQSFYSLFEKADM